ncbi:MAG: S41 family peptidase [Bacilli bacterium]
MVKRIWSWRYVLPLVIAIALVGIFLNNGATAESVAGDGAPKSAMDKIEKAYGIIRENYVGDIDEEKLVDGAIEGMVKSLGDPYSVYMDERMAQQFEQSLGSSFEGIGAEITRGQTSIIIVSPLKGSPAEKAGLRPKDEIVAIDGESTANMTQVQAVLKIRGKRGTEVKLQVKRAGVAKPFTITVVRDKIPLISVHSELKTYNKERIGYINVSSFSEDTAGEFKSHLAKLEKNGAQGLVIDVRGNPGGYLSAVEEMLNVLLPKGKPIFQIENRSGNRSAYYSENNKGKSYPIAVITNKGSASASEILAVALKEAGGYAVVGETSFGKGTVQQAIPLGDGSQIKLTMFKWLSPEGNWIHKKGVTPTIKVEPAKQTSDRAPQNDTQLNAALRHIANTN